jgi:stearoyl-CoA desaturase (delta-9 desaturase)
MTSSNPPQSAAVQKGEARGDDVHVPDNFVEHILKSSKPRPPITLGNILGEINWLNFAILTVTPALAIYGACTTTLRWETAVWASVYYFVTGLGALAVPAAFL